jgi:hypothetical protein
MEPKIYSRGVSLHLGQVYFLQGDHRQAMDYCRRVTSLLEGEQLYERFGQVVLPAVLPRIYVSLCLADAIDLYRAVNMTFWLLQAEATLAKVGEKQ